MPIWWEAAAEAARWRRVRPELMADVGGFLDGMMRLTDVQHASLVALLPT